MKGKGLKIYLRVVTDLSVAPSEDDSDYKRVKEIKSFAPGEVSYEPYDDTPLDREDDVKDHSVGAIEPGETTFGFTYIPADEGQNLASASLGEVVDLKVVWRDGGGEIHRGTLTKGAWSEPSDEHMMKNFTVKRKSLPVEFSAPQGG